jgi:WD domain, G-beta repeat/Planctomycete cytochrome C
MFRYSLFLILLASNVGAADPTYWADVRPILRKHCTVCHNERKLDEPDVSGGLALNTPELIRKGGKVPVLKIGKPDESLLITLLKSKDLKRRMPLDADPLEAEPIAILRKWVETGAAEGVKPKEDDTIMTPVRPRRALDVTFPFSLRVKGKPLELTLPVGPLPPVAAVAFSPDGSKLAVGTYGRVTVWDLKTVHPTTLTNVLAAVNDLKFSPDGSLLAIAGGQPSARGDLRLFSTKDWKLVHTLGGHADVVSCVSFSPDGSKLASASFDKTVKLWTVAEGKLVHTFTGHSDFVYSVAFAPKGNWYATASKDRTGRIVDVATAKSQLTFSGMENEVLAVAVRPDGAQVVTSGLEPQLHWWDATTGERLKRQGGHGDGVNEIAIDKGGKLAVSAGSDKTVRLWNPQSGAAIRTLAPGSVVYAVAPDAAGKRVAAGSADGQTRLYDVETGRLLATLWAGEAGWLAAAPEGYHAISARSSARWAPIDGKSFAGTAPVAKALAGEKLTEPKLP